MFRTQEEEKNNIEELMKISFLEKSLKKEKSEVYYCLMKKVLEFITGLILVPVRFPGFQE